MTDRGRAYLVWKRTYSEIRRPLPPFSPPPPYHRPKDKCTTVGVFIFRGGGGINDRPSHHYRRRRRRRAIVQRRVLKGRARFRQAKHSTHNALFLLVPHTTLPIQRPFTPATGVFFFFFFYHPKSFSRPFISLGLCVCVFRIFPRQSRDRIVARHLWTFTAESNKNTDTHTAHPPRRPCMTTTRTRMR